MYDILAELRLYAAMNGLPKLAEELDDALLLLTAEGKRPRRVSHPFAAKDNL